MGSGRDEFNRKSAKGICSQSEKGEAHLQPITHHARYLNGRLNAAVESDVVGYSTITIKPGYNMIAVNFDNLGEDTSISIQDLFPGSEGGVHTAAASAADADQIMVWNENGEYTSYFLFKAARGTSELDYKWVTTGIELATAKFSSGSAFWYHSEADEDFTVTISGAVSAVAEQEIPITHGYNMIASAFPVNFNPNMFDAATWEQSGATAAATADDADQIMVWTDRGEYTTYFLFKAARGTSDLDYRWVTTTVGSLDAEEEVLASGKGVWYKHAGDGFTLKIKSPLAE